MLFRGLIFIFLSKIRVQYNRQSIYCDYKLESISKSIIKLMQSQGVKANYIKQIKIGGNKTYFPNKYYSPHEFMTKLNQAVKGRFDIRIIEVKYIISKSKHEKDFQEQATVANITQQKQFNNVFDIKDPFMIDLLKEVIKLEPPTDFNPTQYDIEHSMAKKLDENKKIEEINQALKLIVDIQSMKQSELKGKELRSLMRFKHQLKSSLKESQVDVFIKAVMSQPVQEKIQSQKSSKNPIVIVVSGNEERRQQLRLYFHPTKFQQENSDLLMKLCPITNWSLCSFLPESNDIKKTGRTYWNTSQISRKAQNINGSIKTVFYIASHKNKSGKLDALQIYSFLFNEIVIKTVISLAQIKKIQKYRSTAQSQSTFTQYYIHVAYPPRYYISILKPDLGCDDGFIRNWQRTQNFAFLRNKDIIEDEFLRLYLFNNTIVKLRLSEQDSTCNVKQGNSLLEKIINNFKGAIKYESLIEPWDFKGKFTIFNTLFKYKQFRDKFKHSINSESNFQEKNWKLKYLILVLVRYNCILPSQVQKIMSLIDKQKNDLDIYIYILWQCTARLGSVSPQVVGQTFMPYLQKQFNQIKKLSIADITRKISSNTDMISFVFRGSLTPSGMLFNPPTPEMKGRLMKQYSNQSQFFYRISVTDDNQGTLKNQKYITKSALKQKMQKISILNRQYIPLGWSPSQLRSYSLWYMHEYSPQDFSKRLKREQVVSFLGMFDHIQNPAKKAARIGQAFSASWTYLCKQNQVQEKKIPDDYSTQNYNFTDGIGKISSGLLQKISLKLQIRDLSVLQVRYKGSKGILVLDPKLQRSAIHLRPSMIKYDCKHESAAKYLDILDWNKYKAGFLNRQTIVLLKTLGISDKVFQNKQKDHIERISKLSFKDCSIFKHMNEQLNTDLSNLQPANVTILHLLRAGFRLQNEPFFRGVLQTMKKNGYHMLKMKCNIMIDKSARIIGIIDQWDVLQQGQVFCTIADSFIIDTDKQLKRQNVQGDVIITRNPCLHPADIRKLKCVPMAQIQKRFQVRGQQNIYHNYVNCVIFPKKGKIPVTSQISGSDLDGDNFFICWDKQLIPAQHQPAYLIDAPTTKEEQSKKQKKVVSYDQMIDFFVEYLNYQKLGQIDNSHLVHADQSPHFAKSKQCMQLAVIHGKAVDFPKSGFCPEVDPKLLVTKYPDFMQKQQSPQYQSQSILGYLYRDIVYQIRNLLVDKKAAQQKIDDDLIRQLTKQVVLEKTQVRQIIQILLQYEKDMTGLINLAGVDTQYEIYSGNFSIAKDKVKSFGKNRLIATILALRSRYFDQFFNNISYDKQTYLNAKQQDLQNTELFHSQTRKRALLFYLCSYVIKFSADQTFLDDQHFRDMKKMILNEYNSLTYNSEGKYAGFVWFVVPRIIINQKYRIKKLRNMQQRKEQDQVNINKEKSYEEEEEMI